MVGDYLPPALCNLDRMVSWFCCHSQSDNGKGGVHIMLSSFLISVAASMVAYCVCKWLDRNSSDN